MLMVMENEAKKKISKTNSDGWLLDEWLGGYSEIKKKKTFGISVKEFILGKNRFHIIFKNVQNPLPKKFTSLAHKKFQ